jgi:hypothetical protein
LSETTGVSVISAVKISGAPVSPFEMDLPLPNAYSHWHCCLS